MESFLETERMQLRCFTADDVDLLMELNNDTDVMHYINNGRPSSRAEVEEELHHFSSWYSEHDGLGFWAAIEKDTGRFLGWFHLRPNHGAESAGTVELGYRFHRFAWGRGLATEGSRALIDHAFRSLGVDRVNAETMAVHVASRRVMERAGMRLVRTFRAEWPVHIPGDEHGDVEYAVDRDEWSGVYPTDEAPS